MLNTGSLEEKELLRKVTEGDRVAFTLLFETYHHGLGAFIFSIIKSREQAEEIVLDVFLKIWMTREALSEVKNFKAYLFTVSRNAAISALRKIIRERTQYTEWTKDTSAIPAVEMDEKEAYLSLIDEAINALSPQRKKIYLLSREKGMRYKEIAHQMGISIFTVRAHIQQAVASVVEFVHSRMGNELLLLFVLLKLF